jgi:hypothetical protein
LYGTPSIAWHIPPNGNWVAFRDGNVARVARTTLPASVADLGNAVVQGFSKDSSYVALRAQQTGEIQVYDLTAGAPALKWSSGSLSAKSAHWSPSGSRLALLATAIPGSGTYIVDFAKAPISAVKIVNADAQSNPPPTATWVGSGKYLAATVGYKATLWDAATLADVTPASVSQANGGNFRLSSDDRWLTWVAGSQDWNLMDWTAAGSPSFSLGSLPGIVTSDLGAYIGCKSGATWSCEHHDLSSGTPTKTASFSPVGSQLHLRTVGGVHYVFSIESETGKYSRLHARPIKNGTALASRQLSAPTDFLYNGFSCLDCRGIQ